MGSPKSCGSSCLWTWPSCPSGRFLLWWGLQRPAASTLWAWQSPNTVKRYVHLGIARPLAPPASFSTLAGWAGSLRLFPPHMLFSRLLLAPEPATFEEALACVVRKTTWQAPLEQVEIWLAVVGPLSCFQIIKKLLTVLTVICWASMLRTTKTSKMWTLPFGSSVLYERLVQRDTKMNGVSGWGREKSTQLGCLKWRGMSSNEPDARWVRGTVNGEAFTHPLVSPDERSCLSVFCFQSEYRSIRMCQNIALKKFKESEQIWLSVNVGRWHGCLKKSWRLFLDRESSRNLISWFGFHVGSDSLPFLLSPLMFQEEFCSPSVSLPVFC